MSPAPRLLGLLALWTLAGLPPVVWPSLLMPWLAGGGLLLAFAALDGRELWALAVPPSERFCHAALALGVWSRVRVRIRNPQDRALWLAVFDHYPQPAELDGQPQRLRVEPGAWAEVQYRIRPLERGARAFGRIQLAIDSRFGLWSRACFSGRSFSIRVYPDFARIAEYMRLATENRVIEMGIHRQRRRGEGQEFLQLREYREGDSLRRIDWKATARMRKPIARDYQDERNQTVLFWLDCSRRMRSRDALLSHFDYALNALILLARVALGEGDAVGLLSFGGRTRWLAPRRGPGVLGRLVDTVYDLQPELSPPDYGTAARELLRRRPKRALIVLMTNLTDDDGEVLQGIVRLLVRRHLLLIANLREAVLEQTLQQPAGDFRQARLYAAACHYLAARARCQEQLRRQGSLLLDVVPEQLPVALVNRYFDVKRSGRL